MESQLCWSGRLLWGKGGTRPHLGAPVSWGSWSSRRGSWNSQQREQHMQRPEVLRWQSSVGANVVTVRVVSMSWWLSWCGAGTCSGRSLESSQQPCCGSGGRCGQSQAYEEVGKGSHVSDSKWRPGEASQMIAKSLAPGQGRSWATPR